MLDDLQELIRRLLDALPQAALIVRGDGRVILRNAEAEAILPAGDQIDAVLDYGQGSEPLWATEMAALAEGAGRLVRRNLRLTGRGSRQLVVDIHLRDMGLSLSICDRGSGRAAQRGGDCDPPHQANTQARGTAAAGPMGQAPGEPPDSILVLVEDVSGRVSMERRLAASERLAATGALAARIAHELNNPLDGVLRFLGLAQRVANAEAAQYLTNAREGLMRMAGIIRGLLEEGRPWQASGQRAPVQRLLDEAVTAMQPRAQAIGVSVVCDLDGRVEGMVEGSVFQVFCNVIKNSLDAMPNGGMLTIRLRPAGRDCDIEFSDTGCGLTEAEAGRIFDPFYTTKPPADGSGLGLAICREIVGRLGGRIAARGRPEGGATLDLRLPLQPPWKAAPQGPEP
jgi:signal transduction histidine kinase